MRRIAAGLIVIMSVLLVSCKGKTGNTITVGSDKLDNTDRKSTRLNSSHAT